MTPTLYGTSPTDGQDSTVATGTVAVIGAPSSLGAPGPGPEEAPAALRAAGLLDRLSALRVPAVDWGDLPVQAPDQPAAGDVRNQGALAALTRAVAERVGAAHDAGLLPLLLGGDHSVSLGSVGASAARGPVGVLWLDAHGDFNTPETSPSGNVYGMVLAILAGLGPRALVELVPHVPANRIAILGARSLDPGERKNLLQAGVAVYSTEALRALGPERAVERAIAGVVAAGAERIHVSLDLDVLDPSVAPGVWTRSANGLTVEETRAVLQATADSGRLAALDVTELFPARDRGGATARAALSLVKAALTPHQPVQALDWRREQTNLRSSA
jgi:arginase